MIHTNSQYQTIQINSNLFVTFREIFYYEVTLEKRMLAIIVR